MSLRLTLIAFALALPAAAQQTYGPPAAPSLDSIPQQLANLADQPATRTSFTFDRSMIQAAGSYIDPSGQSRSVVAGLSSITVDTFHYQRPAFYEPEAISSLIATYNAAGWKHLVNANAAPGQSAQPLSPVTDLWLHFIGADIQNVVVLVRSSRDMNLIQVAGDLRPLDLIHLSGHFGIPKVDPGAVMVPAPPGR